MCFLRNGPLLLLSALGMYLCYHLSCCLKKAEKIAKLFHKSPESQDSRFVTGGLPHQTLQPFEVPLMEHSREGAKADEYCQEPQHLELPEGKPAAKPQGGQGGGEGEGGDVEAGFDPAYQDKPPQAQDEIE